MKTNPLKVPVPTDLQIKAELHTIHEQSKSLVERARKAAMTGAVYSRTFDTKQSGKHQMRADPTFLLWIFTPQ
ncbi:hypothetical protein E2C01_002377 [Portunus trituberculatus]|uniref:Uncharacterized protein n=1 Tax=Portunus trituberculatus TaxID=210409 RepID=A0A5B7CJS1_PORTR|nr:hypothetical protein [Portunus trituberculatus]